MKNYTITVNGNVYDVVVEEGASAGAPVAAAPVAPKAKHVHVIGDAAKVGNLRTVIWGAWDVCMKL